MKDDVLTSIGAAPSTLAMTKSQLNTSASVLNTLTEVETFNGLWNGNVSLENVDGTFALIEHTMTQHVGTLAGDALTYVTDKLAALDADRAARSLDLREADACDHNVRVIAHQCYPVCIICYPVVCL